MKLADYTKESEMLKEHPAHKFDEQVRTQLREALYDEVPSERIAELVALGRSRARRELSALVEQIMYTQGIEVSSSKQRRQLIDDTLDMVLGLGPIQGMLADASITEIMVNGADKVFFERDGVLYESKERFASEEQLRMVVDRIVSPIGRRIDEQSPIVNARLPEGHRVNAIIPPLAIDGTALTIRKFRESAFTLAELVGVDSLTEPMAQLLSWAVRARKNIAVSGGTGGGKTTLLNALSRQIPKDERIVTIEDSAELKFESHPHVVRLEARMANTEGRGAVTIRDLVVNALRMRPDRIVVGECRGAEALDMLQAMNTGHDGSLTTLHANSPAEVVPRLVMMVRYGQDLPAPLIEAQVASALDLVVQQDRLAGGQRRITQICARHGRSFRAKASAQEKAGASSGKGCGADTSESEFHESEQHLSIFKPVVSWNRRTKRYEWSSVPEWIDDLEYLDIASRKEVLAWERLVQCCL